MSRIDAFVNALNRLTVNAQSPDGSVRMRLANSEGLSVTISPRAYELHDEQSLSEQATAAIHGIQSGYLQGFDRVVDSHTQYRSDPKSHNDSSQARDRQRRTREALSLVETRATSPRRRVRVRLTHPGTATVDITSGTVRRMMLSPEELAEEIRAALVSAKLEFDRDTRRITEQLRNDAAMVRQTQRD